MSLLYNKLIKSIKTAIYESLFDDIDDIVTDNDNTTIIDNISNNYKFVNLGLPSGTLWCTKNLGAETETDPGDYYQWGYTEPVKKGTTLLTKADYTKFNPSGDNKTFTKYNKNNVHYQLENIDDAAQQETYGFFRIPTPEQWQELVQCCRWKLVNINGVNVYRITSKKRKYKDQLYLPQGGIIKNSKEGNFFATIYCGRNYDKTCGFYWTSYNASDPYFDNSKAYADCFYFGKGLDIYERRLQIINDMPRFFALNIRPVYDFNN